MQKNYCYDYPRPAYTADCLVFTEQKDKIVLIKRKNPPFENKWALPGGFVNPDEKGIDACKRELFEETNIIADKLFLLGVYDTPGRDPRGRTITVVYYTYSEDAEKQMSAKDDAAEVRIFSIHDLPELAFDHAEIIRDAINSK